MRRKSDSLPPPPLSHTHTPKNSASVAFFDDSTRNIAGAAAAGIFSVLVGRTSLSETEAPGASAQVASVLDLPAALPSRWTRHGAAPPAALLRGGRLRTEEEAEADELQAREASGAAETAEQVRNALSSSAKKKNVGAGGGGRRRGGGGGGGGGAEEGGSAKESKSPVLAPA